MRTLIDSNLGEASDLKMCFAATGKGLVAIAIQSFAPAHRLGILSELQEHLRGYFPNTADLAANGLVSMPLKAYRWIRKCKKLQTHSVRRVVFR